MKKLTIGLFSLLGFTLCTFLSSSAFAADPHPGAPMMHAPWMSAPPAYRAQMARMAAQRYGWARHYNANPQMARRGPGMAPPNPMMRPPQGVWRQATARPPMWQNRPQQHRSMAPRQRIVARAPIAYYGRPMWRQAQRTPMRAYRPMNRAQRAPVYYSPRQMMAQRARMQGYRPMYQARRPAAPMYRGARYAQGPAMGNHFKRPMMSRRAAAPNGYRMAPRNRWNLANNPRTAATVPPTQISSLGMAMIPRTLR